MTVTKGQRLSTAAAIRHAGLEPKDVKRVTIENMPVGAQAAEKELVAFEKSVATAEKLAAQKEAEKAAKPPSVFARAKTWADDNMWKPTGTFFRENTPGLAKATDKTFELTKDVALSRPEDVTRQQIVRIETRDGHHMEIGVIVRDDVVSQVLMATSAAVGGVGLFPFFGNFVQGGTGILAALASGTTYLFGDKELSASFMGMAKKHFTMGVIGFLPVVGEATAAQFVVDGKRVLTDHDVKVGEIAGHFAFHPAKRD